jgi:hypothetical protein
MSYGGSIGLTQPMLFAILSVVALYYLLSRINRIEEKVGFVSYPNGHLRVRYSTEGVEPKHDPPMAPDPNGWNITPQDLAFFGHFEDFGRILNEYFSRTVSAWRVGELPDSDVGTLDSHGPVLGRQYDVYFGSEVVGHLAINAGWRYALAGPEAVNAKVSIEDARSFPPYQLETILLGVAEHIQSDTPEEIEVAHDAVRNAMIDAMWLVGPYALVHPETLEVQFRGTGRFYLERANLIRRE